MEEFYREPLLSLSFAHVIFRFKIEAEREKSKKSRMEEFCGEPLLSLSFAFIIFLFQIQKKEDKKKEVKDGGVLRGAPALPLLLLEHLVSNTL